MIFYSAIDNKVKLLFYWLYSGTFKIIDSSLTIVDLNYNLAIDLWLICRTNCLLLF